MITYGDYFTGGGMATAGFRDAGLIPIFGVEYDPHPKRLKTSMFIADTYEANFGKHIIRKPVQDIDPADLPRVDWFHASPVCKNASVANVDGGEDEVDIVTAQATIDYFTHHSPKVVTIENVYTYRHFQAYKNIIQALWSCGYGFREDHINMADYGVPQTRNRLIVTAVLGEHMPPLLPPTHEPEPAGFFALPRWVSWYEAIEDLIPTMKQESPQEFIIRRLDEFGKPCVDFAPHCGYRSDSPGRTYPPRLYNEPFFSVTATQTADRAILNIAGVYYGIGELELARFQSLPDWYKLSGKNSVDFTLIGNGVPSLFCEKLGRFVANRYL